MYGWRYPPENSGGRYADVAALLVATGAAVEPGWLADEDVASDIPACGQRPRGVVAYKRARLPPR